MAESAKPQTIEGLSVTREIRIDASPETVFAFFTDPEKMVRWKGTEAELDARPGGVYRVSVIPEQAIARGEYVEIDPPRFVSFTWGWEGDGAPVPPGSSLVEITLEPDGDGTVVTLVHSGLPDQEQADQHGHGWDHFLGRLQIAGAGGDPGSNTFPGAE